MDKYVTDFLCTYQLIEDLDDSETLFRIQLLQAFTPDYFNNEKKESLDDIFNTIDIRTAELYNIYGTNETIKKLMDKYTNDNDDNIKFLLCFSYSSFHIMHLILIGLINNNLDECKCNDLIEQLEIK